MSGLPAPRAETRSDPNRSYIDDHTVDSPPSTQAEVAASRHIPFARLPKVRDGSSMKFATAGADTLSSAAIVVPSGDPSMKAVIPQRQFEPMDPATGA
jgi:hypothetical protein